MKVAEAAQEALNAYHKGNPPEVNEISGDSWTISLPRTPIHTLEELVEHCKIDLTIWEVERFIVNKWEMAGFERPTGTSGSWTRRRGVPIITPLFQVKAWLKKKLIIVAALSELDALRKKAEGYAPQYPAFKALKRDEEILAEFSLHDHHFGSLIWGKETGWEDYDNKLAMKAWEAAFKTLIPRMDGYAPTKALIVLGNDQQNADNRAGSTERGTPQTMDSRYQKVFGISRNASIWAIDALLGKYKSVDVMIVSGNHDPLSAWHLGDSLSSWYRKCKNVVINNSPLFRKYYEFGVNMLMFTHGNAGKLESYGDTMAAEQPAMWGRTCWREAHTGDKHQRRLVELKGATVRILPSLRPPCAWSSENHYVGAIRAAEAYAWHAQEGLVGTAVYSIIRKSK